MKLGHHPFSFCFPPRKERGYALGVGNTIQEGAGKEQSGICSGDDDSETKEPDDEKAQVEQNVGRFVPSL